MSVSYDMATKNARMNAVLSAIDSQTTNGWIEIGTSGMGTVLVQINLQKPSFTESAGVLTMAGAPLSGTAGAAGTAANADVKDGSGTIRVSGLTVGTSGTDIVLGSVAISSGQTVTLNSATITHSA